MNLSYNHPRYTIWNTWWSHSRIFKAVGVSDICFAWLSLRLCFHNLHIVFCFFPNRDILRWFNVVSWYINRPNPQWSVTKCIAVSVSSQRHTIYMLNHLFKYVTCNFIYLCVLISFCHGNVLMFILSHVRVLEQFLNTSPHSVNQASQSVLRVLLPFLSQSSR